ncbi:MAG: FecR domain-containing protein [Odoribacteraceae bacterium]|jgi:ferric-dicitrate binding protein FerR (iron transport regulator)|nr:FecR domain-containing protein [Odoribacteraceae bacterium]
MENKNDRIARLISTRLSGELNEEEERELERWMEEGEENRQLVRELLSGETFEEKYKLYQQIDWKRRLGQFERKHGHRRGLPGRVARHAAIWLLPVAAAVVCYIAVTRSRPAESPGAGIHPGHFHAILYRSTGEEFILDNTLQEPVKLPDHIRLTPGADALVYAGSPEEKIVENKLSTPRGGEYRLTLSDGTRVHLNARSTLAYPESFRDNAREVYLSGEAWFEVAGDTGRPFRVVTDEASITVRGTRFNVNTSRAGIVETALVEGSVGLTFKKRAGEVVLRAGEVAEYHVNTDSLSVRETDLLPHVGWKDNLFVFSGEPLESIMEKLSNWYDFSVVYADAGIASTRFSGYMRKYDDISIILEAIEKTAGVTFTIDRKRVTISRPARE